MGQNTIPVLMRLALRLEVDQEAAREFIEFSEGLQRRIEVLFLLLAEDPPHKLSRTVGAANGGTAAIVLSPVAVKIGAEDGKREGHTLHKIALAPLQQRSVDCPSR